MNQKFRHLDLFSGIGGFALAASWVWGPAYEIVSFCEQDKFCQKVLNKHWPWAPIHTDVKRMKQQQRISMHKGYDYGRINLVSGGFPCQPYSVAGKQRGPEDDRALWPEMFRIVKEKHPDWVTGENVANFTNMGLDDCLSDLESEGYEATTFIIPACGVGAQHRRDRTWIIAHSNELNGDLSGFCPSQIPQLETSKIFGHNATYTDRSRRKTSRPALPQKWQEEATMPGHNNEHLEWNGWALTESPVCSSDDGIPNRVDQVKGYGNAIVPQVVVPIMAAIKQIEESF